MFYFKPVRLTVKQSCLQIVPGYIRGATHGFPTSLTCDTLNSAVNILDPYIKKKRRILNLCCKSCSPFLLTGKKTMSNKSKSYSHCIHTGLLNIGVHNDLTVLSGVLKYALDSFLFLLICEE
jgi:hypothetical protein